MLLNEFAGAELQGSSDGLVSPAPVPEGMTVAQETEALLEKWRTHYGVDRSAAAAAAAVAAAPEPAPDAYWDAEPAVDELEGLRALADAVFSHLGEAASGIDLRTPGAARAVEALLRAGAADVRDLRRAEDAGQAAAERAAALEHELQTVVAVCQTAQESCAEWKRRAELHEDELRAFRGATEAADGIERGLRAALQAARDQLEEDGASMASLSSEVARRDAQLRLVSSECARATDDVRRLSRENESLLQELRALRRPRQEQQPRRLSVTPPRSRGGHSAARTLSPVLSATPPPASGGSLRTVLPPPLRAEDGPVAALLATSRPSPRKSPAAAARAAARAAQRAAAAVAARGREQPSPSPSSRRRQHQRQHLRDVSPPHPFDPAPGLRYAYAVAPPQASWGRRPAAQPRRAFGGGRTTEQFETTCV